MKITSLSTAVISGNFPWVLVKVETDTGLIGLGEAYWGVGVAELIQAVQAEQAQARRQPVGEPRLPGSQLATPGEQLQERLTNLGR